MATVVVSPYRATKYLDRAGNFWVYLQYVLGLQAIGCDVHWLEQLEPGDDESSFGPYSEPEDQASALASTLARWGVRNKPILYADGGHPDRFDPTFVGVGAREAEAVFRRAELLLNFHQRIHPELLSRFERTALVDIDPGLLQYWISSGQLEVAPHDLYFTIGETVGTPAARFPDCGIEWVHIRPPVFLEQWPSAPARGPAPFTTISSWFGSGEYVLEGNGFWDNNKRVSWLRFADLPRYTDQAVELATYFGKKDASEQQLLERKGWRVRHAGDVAATPEAYRSYIQSSRGELSCAKPSCARFENAWMSDRTVCYLASGKPAVVQDTGPSSVPSGAGMHRFSTLDEAVAAIAAVNGAYEQNCRAARELAETYFDAEAVGERIVEAALSEGVPDAPAPA